MSNIESKVEGSKLKKMTLSSHFNEKTHKTDMLAISWYHAKLKGELYL